jgi:hypothetical protein
MKKTIAIVALAATLASCGGNSTSEIPTTDSTSVKCDSTKCDSTKCDSTKVVDTTKAAK